MIHIEKLKRVLYINGPVNKINEIIDALNDCLANYVNKDEFNAAIGNINQQITAINNQIADNTANIADNKEAIDRLNALMDELLALLDQFDPDLKTYIDQGDFLNIAPKMGYVQEDQIQLFATYNISNIPSQTKNAPVLTNDNLDNQVMYYVANGGGPDGAKQTAIHKACRPNTSTPWTYYNTNVTPFCLKDDTRIPFAFYGGDNHYLILKMNDGSFVLIHTEYSFNEEDWKEMDDISSMIIDTGASDFFIHAKWLRQYDTFITINGISTVLNDENWFRVRVYRYSTQELLRTDDLPGFRDIVTFSSGVSLVPNKQVSRIADMTEEENRLYRWTTKSGIQDVNGAVNALLFENEETLTIVEYQISCNTYLANTNTKNWHGVNYTSLSFHIPTAILKGNTSSSLHITLHNMPGDWSDATTELSTKINTELKNDRSYYAQEITNSSYDTLNKNAYRNGITWSGHRINICRISENDVLQADPRLNGIKYNYVQRFYVPDASFWGKQILNGLVMWDRIFIPCVNSKGSSLIYIKDWKFYKGHEDELCIAPKPGTYYQVQTQNFTTPLNSSVGPSTIFRVPNKNPRRWYTSNYFSVTKGITSVRDTDGNPRYFDAQCVDDTIKIREFHYTETQLDETERTTNFAITPEQYKDIKTNVSTTDLNTGDDTEAVLYKGFVAYNPLAHMCFMWGTLDYGNIENNKNIGLTHIVGIKEDGTVVSFGEPKDHIWTNGNAVGRQNTNNAYRNPFMPVGCTIVDAYTMLVFFFSQHNGGHSQCYIVYRFNEDYTDFELLRCQDFNSPHTYSNVGVMPTIARDHCLMYAGSKFGLCGMTHTPSYYNTEKIDIYMQRPLLGTSQEEKSYSTEDIITTFMSKANLNVYKMYNSSSDGLVCYIPSLPVFLGGYFSIIEEAIEVPLHANLNKHAPGASDGYYDANYIYLSRDPDDRTKVRATAEPIRIIPEGAAVFRKILIAAVQTDEEKPIETQYYTINNGYNSWKFRKGNTLADYGIEDAYTKIEVDSMLADKVDKEYVDQGDLLNMAPKIGRYGEDQVQVTSSYNISNIAFAFRRAPVITSDALDREVMYFIGNGGGPDAVNNVALHKAYKAYGSGESIDGTAKPVWNWYNYDVVPQCLADKKNLVIKTIYGCDNTYLIVKVEEGPQDARATKFYRIATNYQFDEAKWIHCQDITAALLPENDRIPGTEQTQRYLLYTKYFPQYHTLAAVWSISLDAKQANWYYVTIWDCGKTFDDPLSFVYGTAFTGQGSLYKAAAGYSFDEQSGDKEAVTSPANSTRATINIDAAAGEENGACNVLIYEKENTLTIVNYNIRIHVYKKLAGVLSDIGSVPIVFKLSNNFFSADKNIARSITTYNEPGDYLVGTKSAYQVAVNKLNEVGLASQVNNVSYDSKKKKAYTIGMDSERSIRIRKFAATDFDTLYSEDKYRGLKAEAFTDTFCCPDASKWGKAFRVGTALWDRFIIGCLNNQGESCLQITEWQKVQDYPDSNLYIEPKPGNPKSVSTQVFRSVLDEDLFKFTGDISPRVLNGELLFNEEKFPWDTYTILPGIVSVKRVDQNNKAEYYKAQYNKETKKIIWCQFNAKKDEHNVELDPIEIQRDIKDPISVTDLETSLFNTGHADTTFIYPGFVAYNPMMERFYIWGICDGTYSTTGNVKIPHLVSIDATTGKATSLNFQDPDTGEIRISKPNDYNWTGTDSKYPSTITGSTYYTPYMPYGCVIIDKTHMIIFFQCGMPGSSRHIYGLLYTFSEDGKTLSSVTVCSTNQTGIGYLNRGYNSNCGNMPLIYAGPKLGLCGFGETKNGISYYKDNYKLDIRTQYPIYKPGKNEKLFDNTSSYTDKQIIENSTSMFENINNYTMFNQSSGGLIAFIPPLEIFLGGYHSITETGMEVVLQPNKDNFIYLKRVNGDRTAAGIVAEVDAESTEPMIPPGTSVFDKICIAKVTTDADKPIATKIYTVNTGDNAWKFQSFNPSVDIYLET